MTGKRYSLSVDAERYAGLPAAIAKPRATDGVDDRMRAEVALILDKIITAPSYSVLMPPPAAPSLPPAPPPPPPPPPPAAIVQAADPLMSSPFAMQAPPPLPPPLPSAAHMRPPRPSSLPVKCPECGKVLSCRGNLNRHKKTAHMGHRVFCSVAGCGLSFGQGHDLRRHMRRKHQAS